MFIIVKSLFLIRSFMLRSEKFFSFKLTCSLMLASKLSLVKESLQARPAGRARSKGVTACVNQLLHT